MSKQFSLVALALSTSICFGFSVFDWLSQAPPIIIAVQATLTVINLLFFVLVLKE